MQNIKKTNLYKNKLIKYGLIYVSSIVILTILSILIINYNSKEEEEIKSMQQQIDDSDSQIKDIERKMQELVNITSLWNQINNQYSKRKGLEIDKAKILIDDFRNIYDLIGNIVINLSSPVELTNIYKTDTTVISSSTVQVSFSTFDDITALRIVDTISKNLPGFVVIKQLIIDKKSNINDDIIGKISNGKYPRIIDTQLYFEWRNFKDVIK